MKLSGNKAIKNTIQSDTGFILFEGASLFDKKPIVGIVTYDTTNKKTGNMAQLWILRSDIKPNHAVKSGDDQSVCGGCVHRHNTGGACYVLPYHAPLAVYNKYKRGGYTDKQKGLKQLQALNKGLRLGAYGDCAMLSAEVLAEVVAVSAFHTGYTHQWQNKRLRHALDYCQASVDSSAEYYQARDMGITGTFRVVQNETELLANEIECLADSKGITCADCRKCDGNSNIAIMIHGSKASRFNESTIPIKVVG
jgi:hypothetical protein